MKRFLLPVVLILLTSCFGAGNLCAQANRLVKEGIEAVVKGGTKAAAEQAARNATAQIVPSKNFIQVMVKGHTFKLPENYKELSNNQFAAQLFTKAKSNPNKEIIETLNIKNDREGKMLVREINATVEALATLLRQPEIVVAYSHNMPILPGVNKQLQPLQRLEQLNKAIDEAINNPQEIIETTPNVPVKKRRTAEEHFVQAAIFTEVYGRWPSRRVGINALISPDDEHRIYATFATMRSKYNRAEKAEKDDAISNAIFDLMDEYATNPMSPDEAVDKLEEFTQKNHRLPSLSSEDKEEHVLANKMYTMLKRYPDYEQTKKINEITEKYRKYTKRNSPSEWLEKFYVFQDGLKAKGESPRLPRSYRNKEELDDNEKAEAALGQGIYGILKTWRDEEKITEALKNGTLDEKEAQAIRAIKQILSNRTYHTRTKSKTTQEVTENLLAFVKEKQASPRCNIDKPQEELYYSVFNKLYSTRTKTSPIKKSKDYYEEFSRTGVATPHPEDTRFEKDPDLYTLLQLDQLARACERGEQDWAIFDAEDPLAELAKRINSQEKIEPASSVTPVQTRRQIDVHKAEQLWNYFPSWSEENRKYFNSTANSLLALDTLLRRVKKMDVEHNKRTTEILDDLTDMPLGQMEDLYYKVIFRGQTPGAPQPGDFHSVAEEKGVPMDIAQNAVNWGYNHIQTVLSPGEDKLINIILDPEVTPNDISLFFDDILGHMAEGKTRMGWHELDLKNYYNGSPSFGKNGQKGILHIHFERLATPENGLESDVSFTLRIDARQLLQGINTQNGQQILSIYRKYFANYINL